MGGIFKRKCDFCGKDYEGYGAKYCSKECSRNADKPNKTDHGLDEEAIIAEANSSEYRRRYKKLLKQKAFEEKVCKVVKESIIRLPSFSSVPIPKMIPNDNKKINEEAGLLFSDTHIGQTVDEDEMGGFGHYDFRTFQFRYQYLIDRVVDIVKNKMIGYNINKLNIMALGDMVTGRIHDELIESAEGTVIEWCFGGAFVVAQGLRELAQHFNQIDIDCVVGNHGRLTVKPTYVRKYVNWDQVFYIALMLMLRDQKNIKFNIPKSFFLTKKINGHNFLILHGDNCRSWSGIPWYGIGRMLANFTELMSSKGEFFDYACMGHFHNDSVMRKVNGERLINGSFTGGDQYSLGKLITISSPVQILFGVHKDIGISWRFPMQLDKAPETGNPKYEYDVRDNIANILSNGII